MTEIAGSQYNYQYDNSFNVAGTNNTVNVNLNDNRSFYLGDSPIQLQSLLNDFVQHVHDLSAKLDAIKMLKSVEEVAKQKSSANDSRPDVEATLTCRVAFSAMTIYYVPSLITLLGTLCSTGTPASAVNNQAAITYPDAPSTYTIPLPGALDTAGSQISSGMFPVKLNNVMIGQQIELDNIILTTPIHVHTPAAHVGQIYDIFPGQTVTALEAAMLLQQLSQTAIDRNGYAQLLPEMKARVKAAFIQRNGASLNAAVVWDDFVAGKNNVTGPVGRDLLLGVTEVWGIESASLGGFSVLHLA
ncbi:hypothetical protein AN958_11880 [Leucoagaricus sp. SymC.cos]|nr:hypothetical protein AN958_11880 [Leucoagaricus sp. SymC.cos]